MRQRHSTTSLHNEQLCWYAPCTGAKGNSLPSACGLLLCDPSKARPFGREESYITQQSLISAVPPASPRARPSPPSKLAMGTGGGDLIGYFTVALVVLSVGAALCVRDLVLWARFYGRVNSVLKAAVWITLGGTILSGVQMAVAVEGLRHGGLTHGKGEWEGGSAAGYET
jgi:hypothetical protein